MDSIIIKRYDSKESALNITWKELKKMKEATFRPFQLPLFASNHLLMCEKLITLSPKKEMIVYGQFAGQPAVIKLILKKSWIKERGIPESTAAELLAQSGIPTPKLFYHGYTSHKQGYALVYEQLDKANSFAATLEKTKRSGYTTQFLYALTEELAMQHVLGVYMKKGNLKNFIVTDDRIYTLSNLDIEALEMPLPKPLSLANLDLFLRQLGTDAAGYREKLFHHYATLRGWQLRESDLNPRFGFWRRVWAQWNN